MIYFLDFDRTIFDYDAFVKEAVLPYPEAKMHLEEAAQHETGAKERLEAWKKLADFLEQEEAPFDKNRLPMFLFPDARVFLEAHGKDVVIVTSGHVAFQSYKVTNCLKGLEWRDTIYVEGLSKGTAINDFLEKEPQQALFVDDFSKQLDGVTRDCPNVSVYEMRRDGKEGTTDSPVLRSFDDLKI